MGKGLKALGAIAGGTVAAAVIGGLALGAYVMWDRNHWIDEYLGDNFRPLNG